MRRSAPPSANLENEAEGELTAKKNRPNNKVTTMATMDNGTMVESFKFLNYCQLAKNSLVSKRFCNLIRAHRNSLARLYVSYIHMLSFPIVHATIEVFDKELSAQEYNECIICNGYSKQILLEDQIASAQSSQNNPNIYAISAYAYYKNPTGVEESKWSDRTSVFSAKVELNHENWPIFQHFICLVTDPFIYIDFVRLSYQNDVLNSLAEAINTYDGGRFQCNKLAFQLESNCQQSIAWAKNHVRCNEFRLEPEADLNHDEAFLDFFLAGARCTPSVVVSDYDISKAVINFVQKFRDLENWDEYQGVQSIEGLKLDEDPDIQVLKNDYAKFLVKEELDEDDDSTTYVFEFVNNAVGKKLQLTATIYEIYENTAYNFVISCVFVED